MELNKAIEALRKYATDNKMAHDTFAHLAMRQRLRPYLTVRALQIGLMRDGFKYSVKECETFIARLHKAGLGDLKSTRSGRVIAIYGLKHRLSDLGAAVIGKGDKIRGVAPRHKYSPIPASLAEVKQDTVAEVAQGVASLVRSILADSTVSPEKRVRAARELLAE
jgi:hypothetical protein